ncbi:MAG TPA: MFS transporter [Fimbriimonadaceae bacterium]|jgi:MFS family permease
MATVKGDSATWKGFVAAWLGWCFDGMDGYLYALVALPFVTELVGSSQAAKQPAAWVQAAFLFGWAIGGALFGRLGDKIGRAKTLNLTILTFALFTGLSTFSTSWQMLMVFRFISALGIGGEWAAGSALVSETLHPKHRTWASATLQTGFQFGMIAAALAVGFFSHFDVRYVFLIGVIPALLTLWIRFAVPEPPAWREERQTRQMPKISDLFAPSLIKVTLLTLGLAGICLTTVWAFLFFNVQILTALPEVKALAGPDQKTLLRNVTIEFCLWNVAGNFVAGYVAKLLGFRKAFALYMAASAAIFLLVFNHPFTLSSARLWFDLYMFFGSAIFGIFPLYVPLLFPTLLRTTGAGFCYNFGRMVAGVGTLAGGWITAKAGGPATAIWWVGFLYIPGVVLAFFMPEIRAEPAVPETELAAS